MEISTDKLFDVRLPQLHRVLDAPYMKEFFSSHFNGDLSRGRGEIAHCKIIGKRYKPGKRCLVTYALDFNNSSEQQILFTRIESIKKAEKKAIHQKPKGARLISELGMLVWEFPYDPKLQSLVELSNANRLQEILTELGIFDPTGNGAVQNLTVSPVNYVPRRHCGLLVKRDKSAKVFGKVYANGRGPNVYSAMEQLWRLSTKKPMDFAVAEPLAYDCKRKALWQRWYDSWSFLQFVREKSLPYACHLVAVGLAGFHQASLSGLPGYTQADSYDKLLERTGLMLNYCPSYDKQIRYLRDRIHGLKSLWKPARVTPIHGDFNTSQILFDFEKPVFIDFDSVSLGDPLYDVAHFVAGLYRLNAEKYVSQTEVELASGVFIDTYKRLVPWEVSEEGLNGQIAMALICRRAYKALRQLEKNTVEKVSRYLGLAEEYLNK